MQLMIKLTLEVLEILNLIVHHSLLTFKCPQLRLGLCCKLGLDTFNKGFKLFNTVLLRLSDFID